MILLILIAAPTADPVPTITLSSYASNSGWGRALSFRETVSGSWSEHEFTFYINYLDLKAIELCVLSF